MKRSVLHFGSLIVFSIILLMLAGNMPVGAQVPIRIQVNQVGFYPDEEKAGVVEGKVNNTQFFVISVDKKDTVYKGNLSEEKFSAYSNTKTRIANFTAFKRPGSYFLFVPGAGISYPFRIKSDIYHEPAVAVLRGYYYMRSDMPLTERYAGKWKRPAGHPDTNVQVHASAATALRPTGYIIKTPSGWYDAGDYNKYVVNSGITMGTLLSAYEDFPNYFDHLKTNIPESGDAVPDILNEAIYNLRWMLTMQDPNDGGVYHKCTNAVFDGFVMPGVTKAPRYVVQKSTAAALDFAAVTAQAARLLKPFNKQLPGLADSCLTASAYAWKWAQQNPSIIYSQREINRKYDPDILTGEYGDRSVKDEWFWAAAELYCTTKNGLFLDSINRHLNDSVSLPSWGNVAMLGYYSLIRLGRSLPQLSTALQEMKRKIKFLADGYILKQSANAYGTAMGQSERDFNWGSNSVAANQGILLIYTYLLTKEHKYLEGALSNADYLLGRNATGYSFITGIGSKPPMHPHHRPSSADGITDPVPGLLVGGPNPGRQDKCDYPYLETEKSYSDIECSYASNEIAINWNAPAVYLLHAIEALKNK